MLEKNYRPEDVEKRLYEEWESGGAFRCNRVHGEEGGLGDPYAIVIPPPNVTGSLHMGHALNNTMQDILIRYKRMTGGDVLWQPGTDHAGIATQMVVERQMEKEKLTRHDLGREKFIERIWKWKAESGGTITGQLRSLGASCDWERERFTMDEGLSRAVRKVFVQLHKEDLIYRDKRLVNWDPLLHTAISDLEVEQREVQGTMWYFKYPLADDPSRHIIVGTTRPETMLGDTAVAVHPDDERYTDLVGKDVLLPIVNRRIPIIADDYADPEKGSGAVKITPAHDFNDFEVGKRAKLLVINVLDREAGIRADDLEIWRWAETETGAMTVLAEKGDDGNQLTERLPDHLRGLDRFEARDVILKDMERLGLLDKIEENPMTVPYGDRSGVVIEPFLTDQWFVRAEVLAKPAIEAVEQGKTVFVPKNWEKTYFEWMRNIQPWCISRQIWWGHQIPAWFGPDETIFVELTEEEAHAAAEKHYGHPVELQRETDVLDTWFSSALWPFSTLGWPDKTPELAKYYPTDVLITGFDIIFFWVARMMMMGLHFMKDVPFHTVYIHALVRDEKGQKMSKSKGNVIDPLVLAEKYGADAMRFTLTAFAAQGRDVKLSESRVEGYRNFVTKLWNAARFCEMNECKPVADFDPRSCSMTLNKWIIGKLAECQRDVEAALDGYRFNEVAGALYQFTWGTFCDWHLEFAKPVLQGDDEAARAETRATTAWVLDNLLHLLHPIMPFVTEELWRQLAEDRPYSLVTGKWPQLGGDLINAEVAAEMDWVVRLVTSIRAVRSEMNVPAGAKIDALLRNADDGSQARLATHRDLIERLARLEKIETLEGDVPDGSVQAVLDESTIVLPLASVIDVAQEKARLEKEMAKLNGDITKADKKLANPGFLAKAPPEVVETEKERREEARAARSKLAEALEMLQGAL
ncbi:valine--tRNA ligase [Magnetospira sp. QH-2]|uniref:valine--tRNA ligase n=1 Tax=Magnetospira sp. (strain QH-2) TaxID=1288970 RepID=UPI0003E81A6C|nr:valine--tRNA ligase [Magnetospira sp. QH-2]CCQ73439.1 Valyl-tRNA synthetase (Valine--tRNA ligase) [Magnetospira sp. QH-2]